MNYLECFLAKFSDFPTDPPERTEETPRESGSLGLLGTLHGENQKNQAAPPSGSGYRESVAYWPIELRQRWADLAESDQAAGLDWKAAEWLAFLDTVDEINAAQARGQAIDFQEPPESDDEEALRQILAWPADAPFLLGELTGSSREWNAAVSSRPGNPEKEKPPRRWSGRPQWSTEDQEAREAEREHQRENLVEASDPETLAFLAVVEEKHRAYWAARPHGGNTKLLFDRRCEK